MILSAAVLNLIWIIILALLIKRNISRFKNKNNNGILINAEVIEWKVLCGQPTRYILDIEYQMENVKQNICSISYFRTYKMKAGFWYFNILLDIKFLFNYAFFQSYRWLSIFKKGERTCIMRDLREPTMKLD